MIIDIIGGGSLGLLMAGRLIQSGSEVRLWCRGVEQCQMLSQSGLTVSYEDETKTFSIPGDRFVAGPIWNFAATYLSEPSHWIFITVKQDALHNDLPKFLSELRETQTHIVCFQNGYGHMDMLSKLLPNSKLYVAVTTEAAKRKSLIEVIHAGVGGVWIGEWNNGSHRNGQLYEINMDLKENYLIDALTLAGFSALLSKEVDTMIYRKLLINAVINPLTAIWRISNGELLASDHRMQLMKELYDEAIAVYDACGVVYEDDIWDNILEVCRNTSGNTSSMLADVLASKTTEIRWINGSLVEMAEQSGMEVPLHRWVCQLIEGMISEER